MSQTNPQPSSQQQATQQYYNALRSYFYNQGQRMQKLKSMLDSNIIAHGFRFTLSVLLEIFFYLSGLCALVLLFLIPNDPLAYSYEFEGTMKIEMSSENEELIAAIIMMKIIFCFLSVVPSFFCGVMLHRSRNKRSRIRLAYEEVVEIKDNHEKAIRDFRLM
ncbi:MAG: hypothetical protein IM638_16925 [Bacteroidetes bacterium]|nr:hypothetical protein [Bacteroidota bacterium]